MMNKRGLWKISIDFQKPLFIYHVVCCIVHIIFPLFCFSCTILKEKTLNRKFFSIQGLDFF